MILNTTSKEGKVKHHHEPALARGMYEVVIARRPEMTTSYMPLVSAVS